MESSATETRITSETGGQKGSKPTQLFWIDPYALEALGAVAGYGCDKYESHNYRRGVNVSLHINAAFRHILRFMGGETLDPESGLQTLAHGAWNLLAAITQIHDHPEFDDRWNPHRHSEDSSLGEDSRTNETIVPSVQPTPTPMLTRYINSGGVVYYPPGVDAELLANEKAKMAAAEASKAAGARWSTWRTAMADALRR